MMKTMNAILGTINTSLGMVFVAGILVFLTVKGRKERKKDAPSREVEKASSGKTENAPPGEVEKAACKMDMLSGEVIDVTYDEETGLSLVSVKDNKGEVAYGFSKMPARDLKTLYCGKGYVQIPIVTEKTLKRK